jgi:endonuclease/exonuclease/phosphatase family metal-dependent hydrolase
MLTKIITWNIEYGKQLENVIEALKVEDADILLLQELDIFCGKRSNNHDVPLEISKALGMQHYVFTQEYVEVGINSGKNGTHGNAIMSKYPIEESWNKTFDIKPFDWQKYGWIVNKPRMGGRCFLASRIGDFLYYSVHLENIGGALGRIAQMEELIKDAEEKIQDARKPIKGIFIGGDMNTIRSGITRFLPMYYPCSLSKILENEPLGFSNWVNQRFGAIDKTFGTPTVRHLSGLYQEKLDWLLVKDIEGASFELQDCHVGGTERESDHRYVCATLSH